MREGKGPGRRLFVLAVLLGVAHQAGAQEILFRFDGSQAGETFGAVVARLGDLDADGMPDIGVSAPLSGELHPSGRVAVYSGAGGAPLFQIDAADPRGMCWAMAIAGDVDGDGVPDILIGTPFSAPPIEATRGLLYAAGRALVYSGRTREMLFVFDGDEQGAQLGRSVASLGDINGDGVPDLVIGAPYATVKGRTGAGRAIVLSGRDGQAIFRFDGSDGGDSLGWSVAGIGDVDGDGVSDILMGAPDASPGGRAQAGSVFVRSGATGELIARLDGEAARDRFGHAVALAGELDGDGSPDFMVAAPGAGPDGRSQAGGVFVYGGGTREVLFRFDGVDSFDGLGASIAGGGDVDGDGVPDLIAGAPSASPDGRVGAGSAFVFSGATGVLVVRVDGLANGDALGFAVAVADDLDSDGHSEIIVGSPYADPEGRDGAGSVFVLSVP